MWRERRRMGEVHGGCRRFEFVFMPATDLTSATSNASVLESQEQRHGLDHHCIKRGL